MNACISKGNTKLGGVPNISLTPGTGCTADRGKAPPCSKDCYAMKILVYSAEAKKAYARNLLLARKNPDSFFQQVRGFLMQKSPRYFRWHVAGDILSVDYFARMVLMAHQFPGTRFLAFTKQYDIVNGWRGRGVAIPKNLAIVFSAWPGLPLANPHHFPVAWMKPKDGSEDRIPKRALECPGNCETCGSCWTLKRDVVFHQH